MFYGRHPAVLGITEDVPAGYQRVFGDHIVDNARGKGVESVLDLMTPQGYSATVEQAQRQKQLGADVIALSCTGMSSIQIAPALERETGLPVLDPVMCEGLMTLFELIRKDARTPVSYTHLDVYKRQASSTVPCWLTLTFNLLTGGFSHAYQASN